MCVGNKISALPTGDIYIAVQLVH